MTTQLTLKLHNAMNQIQWFAVVDNVSNQTVLDANLEVDEVRQITVASNANGHADITYTPKGYVGTHRDELNDGDTVDMTSGRQAQNPEIRPDLYRLGWGDFAEIAGSVVAGYFLDDPSIPIDVAIAKLAPQLADLQNRLEKIVDELSQIEDFLNNLLPAIRGVLDVSLTNESMGRALGAYQDIQDIMAKPSAFSDPKVQDRLTRRLESMHDEITGTIGLLNGGMSSLYATGSAFACYAKAYMAQQRLLEPRNRTLIWDTTFHRYYMDMIYRIVDAASVADQGYKVQMKTLPLGNVYRFDPSNNRSNNRWIESGLPIQDSYMGGDFHNLFRLHANEVYPKRTGLLTTFDAGMVHGWEWTGAELTGPSAQNLYKDPATVQAANSFWKQQKPTYLEIENFYAGMGDFKAVRTKIEQNCDTKNPAWYPRATPSTP